ncbi:TetR/AcrR family transcriptional regulator [Catellatospora coxensis]|uniref:TetR family transcriptional regulator n=1 Tax=Catellatospora coxensis TaxID=310354 RepID=A0A8J3P650_9ACTN|nr:TetR/AcrR family transcriptional regulator [Catellatospora coxensis]GIG05119.1 TetR family transcriptional regulator [Catellatospora coxensis]
MPSITRRPSAGAERRLPVEAQILGTVSRLLREGAGYTELGVQRIAAESGVARSTFYLYFADKTQLLLRLADTMSQTSFGIASAWRPLAGLDALTATFGEVIATYRANAEILAAVHEASAYDPIVRDFWDSRLEPFRSNVRQVLAEELAAGRTPADVHVEAATRLMIDGGDRFLLRHVTTSEDNSDDAAARELAATWWYGVFRRPSPGSEPRRSRVRDK